MHFKFTTMNAKKKNNKTAGVLMVMLIILLAACKKDLQPHSDNTSDGQVAFINASAQLFSDLGFNGNAYILKDITDTTYKPVNLSSPDMPYLNKQYKYQYPSTNFNATLAQPWVNYLHTSTGAHQFILIDTAHYLRVKDEVDLKANTPVSIYYADSLGYFRSFILEDQLINEPGKVRLRFLNLSPDAGDVFFTINEKPASSSGFINSFKYGSLTSFVSYPNIKRDTLRINFYRAGDSTTVVATTFLQADPGRSYTLALQGYYSQFVSYPDPKDSNKYKSLTGGLSVLVHTNN
jgi:hypothetical protein